MANIMLSYWYRLYQNQTKHERLLEGAIAKFGVRYRTQHPFLAQKAFADFYFPDHNLIVEVDDPGHLKKEAKAKDALRTEALGKLGLRVIRFTNYEIEHKLDTVVSTIGAELVLK